jgi:cell division inhibitor SulA
LSFWRTIWRRRFEPQEANWRGNGAPAARAVYKQPASCNLSGMIELVRTNDPVVISFIEALMRDAKIAFLVADQNMSIMEGSLGVLPRRILVDEDDLEQAKRILQDAGIADEIRK